MTVTLVKSAAVTVAAVMTTLTGVETENVGVAQGGPQCGAAAAAGMMLATSLMTTTSPVQEEMG